jgi:hypothetical protein
MVYTSARNNIVHAYYISINVAAFLEVRILLTLSICFIRLFLTTSH